MYKVIFLGSVFLIIELFLFFFLFFQTSKRQFHCDKCGICRIGGRDNFFHCDRCGCCYSVELRERHTCVEKSMHQDCAICMEVCVFLTSVLFLLFMTAGNCQFFICAFLLFSRHICGVTWRIWRLIVSTW